MERPSVDKMTKESFYNDAKEYWKGISPTVDGMLGGFGRISGEDINGSLGFLKPFLTGDWDERIQSRRALDCGSGIGRITKHLLLQLFQSVDMVEQTQKFLDEAKAFIGEESSRVERLICRGLQVFTPQPEHYDVIWCQWVLGHLTDEHLVHFLKRCKTGLTDNGIICVKENIAKSGVVFDDQDSSVTRSTSELKKLFKLAGMKIIKEETQKKFPLELFTVKMYALR